MKCQKSNVKNQNSKIYLYYEKWQNVEKLSGGPCRVRDDFKSSVGLGDGKEVG